MYEERRELQQQLLCMAFSGDSRDAFFFFRGFTSHPAENTRRWLLTTNRTRRYRMTWLRLRPRSVGWPSAMMVVLVFVWGPPSRWWHMIWFVLLSNAARHEEPDGAC